MIKLAVEKTERDRETRSERRDRLIVYLDHPQLERWLGMVCPEGHEWSPIRLAWFEVGPEDTLIPVEEGDNE